jgi:hypothetical protein
LICTIADPLSLTLCRLPSSLVAENPSGWSHDGGRRQMWRQISAAKPRRHNLEPTNLRIEAAQMNKFCAALGGQPHETQSDHNDASSRTRHQSTEHTL